MASSFIERGSSSNARTLSGCAGRELMGRFLVLRATRVCRNQTLLRDTGSGNEDNRAKGPSRHTHRSPMVGRHSGNGEVAYELQRIIAGLPPF